MDVNKPPLFLYQAVSMCLSAAKLDVFTWKSTETDSLLEPDPSGQLRNCNQSNIRIEFNPEGGMLPTSERQKMLYDMKLDGCIDGILNNSTQSWICDVTECNKR